ncbi:hypothetical protein M8J77_025602 [Diaphorina citri]|nr:hypothetical protein M8J77_025602 [Diaphorina citri]
MSPLRLTLFADDTNFFVESENLDQVKLVTRQASTKIDHWININGLVNNTDKTMGIIFNRGRESNQNHPGDEADWGQTINFVPSARFLGVLIDSSLNYKDHVDMLCSKLNSGCYMLRSLRDKIDDHCLKSVYYAHVHSHISYGIMLWGNSTRASDVFVCQKRAIRILKRGSYNDPCRAWFGELQILTLPSLYILETLKFVKRNLDKFECVGPGTVYQTRYRENNQNTIRTEAHKTALFERSVRHNGGILFNALPEHIKILNMDKFDSTLKQTLIRHSFYSVAEYLEFFQGGSG